MSLLNVTKMRDSKDFVASAIITCKSLEQLESAKKIIPFFQALFCLEASSEHILQLDAMHKRRYEFLCLLQQKAMNTTVSPCCPGCNAPFELVSPDKKGEVPKMCFTICKSCGLPLKRVAANEYQKIPASELTKLHNKNREIYRLLMNQSFLIQKKNALKLPALN